MDMVKFLAHRAALLGQCPSATPVAEESRQPIHIETVGATGLPVLMIHGGFRVSGGGNRTFEGQKPLANNGFQLRLADRPDSV